MQPEEIAKDILRWAANQDRDFGGALEIEWVDRIADALRTYGDARAAAERERCEAVCWKESEYWRAIERRPFSDFNRHYAEASTTTAERIAAAIRELS